MKKTQKVIDALQYIESLDLTTEEAERLQSEVEDMTFREEEYIPEYDPMTEVERENCKI